ncbi:MAG: peptidylprolyl isomerase [Muribaculaceae bacterium]
MEQIKFGKYVELAYTVSTVDGNGEEVMHEFTAKAPDRFVFGLEDGMIANFMTNLEGKTQGDEFCFDLQPSEAFGEVNPDFIMTLSRDTFLIDGKFDDETVKPGNVVPMKLSNQQIVHGLVTKVDDKNVELDFNHPLAGETLRYKGRVLLVRDSTPEERNPRHSGCGGCSGCGSNDGGCNGCNGCNS